MRGRRPRPLDECTIVMATTVTLSIASAKVRHFFDMTKRNRNFFRKNFFCQNALPFEKNVVPLHFDL